MIFDIKSELSEYNSVKKDTLKEAMDEDDNKEENKKRRKRLFLIGCGFCIPCVLIFGIVIGIIIALTVTTQSRLKEFFHQFIFKNQIF